MEESFKFKLIEGNFTPPEAGKVLFNLINSKIGYHQLEKFGIQERTNGDVSRAEGRINALKTVNKELLSFLNEANDKGMEFSIKSIVTIKVKKPKNKKKG